LYLVYVFFFLMLFLPEFVFFIGSVTGSLASEEELTAGVRSKWLEGGD
jgi:hypothetical protein